MPKHTSIPKPKSKKKQLAQAKIPETADDFLALGVENEEAAEKWRAGDAAKSSRFYVRALEAYEGGLARYSSSFDLAYNKARLQYTITQYPALSAEFPGDPTQLLNVALESHNRVLRLDGDNVDVLFNTAQVTTSLAEAIDNNETSNAAANSGQAVQLVKQAIELFQRCLARQELRYAEEAREQAQMSTALDAQQQRQQQQPVEDHLIPDAVMEEEGEEEDEQRTSPSTTTRQSQSQPQPQEQEQEQEQWATIHEPTTPTTLTETILGLLDALTTLCAIAGRTDTLLLEEIESLAQPLLELKLPSYLVGVADETTRLEALLSRVGFAVGLAELRFKTGRIDVAGYDGALRGEFEPLVGGGGGGGQENSTTTTTTTTTITTTKQSPEILLAYVDAIIAFNTLLSLENTTTTTTPTTKTANHAPLRWTRLTKALTHLTQATHLVSPTNVDALVSIHTSRGDTELRRLALCLQPGRNLPESISNAGVQATLLRNARAYYKAAADLLVGRGAGQNGKGARRVLCGVVVKEAVTRCLLERGNGPIKELYYTRGIIIEDGGGDAIKAVVGDMVEDSLVTREVLVECNLAELVGSLIA